MQRNIEFAQHVLDIVTIDSNRALNSRCSLFSTILPAFPPAEIPHDEYAKGNFWIQSSYRVGVSGCQDDIDNAGRPMSGHSAIPLRRVKEMTMYNQQICIPVLQDLLVLLLLIGPAISFDQRPHVV